MKSVLKCALVGLCLTLSILLVACGSSTSTSSNNDTGTSSTSSTSSGSGEQQQAPKLEKTMLTISTPTTDINFLPVFVAQAKGFWTEEGLTTNIVTFQGSREQLQAMISGASDLAASAYTEVIDSYITGNDLKSFWGQSNNPAYQWWSAIQTLDDAKAKNARFAISTPGSLTDVLTRWMIQQAGYNVDDFQIVGVGGPAERWAALKSGQVDVAILTAPGYYVAEKEGYNQLVKLEEFIPEFALEVWYGKQSFLRENPETVKAVLRGYTKAVRWLQDDSNLAEAAKISCDRSGLCDLEEAERTVKEIRRFFPEDGRFADEGEKFLLQTYVDRGDLPSIPPLTDLRDMTFYNYFKENPMK